MDDQILKQVRKYVISLYSEHHTKRLVYHNLKHAKDLVKGVRGIASQFNLEESDLFVLEVAAWFQDSGNLLVEAGQKQESANLAKAFLERELIDHSLVEGVVSAILATGSPQTPKNLLEEILCDADLAYLADKRFDEESSLHRKEQEFFQGVEITKADWHRTQLTVLQNHRYLTDYALKSWEPGKQKNIKWLNKKIAAADKKLKPVLKKSSEKELTGTSQNKDRPDRGIETMFRITSSNNQRLSDMADNKANILITVNSIILSVIISLLLRKLETRDPLAYPTFLLLLVSLVTITISILATRPSIPDGVFSRTDLDDKSVNLLFFGNFYKMGLDEYSEGMFKVMDDRAFVYNTLVRDIYGQGVVLGKKYQLLRLAYNVFMFGLIVSIISFIMVSAWDTSLFSK